MVGVRKRGEEIRQFILDNVTKHPLDIAKVTAEAFGISRQAVNRHIHKLIDQDSIDVDTSTGHLFYQLTAQVIFLKIYPLDGALAEDAVWRTDIAPLLGDLPENVINLWYYGFTEMLNNAIDHSGGSWVYVAMEKTAIYFQIRISDDGEGIFKKIQKALNLFDERHALLELAKGKLTTDPSRHTGEGIFFTSRAFDEFSISSGGIFFSHFFDDAQDWISQREKNLPATVVFMRLGNRAEQTLKSIFDQSTSGEEDDFPFSKIVVPVKLAQYSNEALMSRSQAKRVLARIEKFKIVIFDFKGVETIGQAFADEIFRVFAQAHPDIELSPINANPDVQAMISRALAAR